MRWLDTTFQDLHFALRLLRKSPGFTLLAIGTIALGIGANTAIYSVVHAILIQPLPYRDPGRLVSLSQKAFSSPGLDRLSMGTGRELLERSGVLEDLVYYRDGAGGRLIADGEADILRGQRVSTSFFDTLGIRAELGRTFVPADKLPGGNAVMILSHALWQTRFGSDPTIIGRTLQISGYPVRIIGVLPASFHPVHMSNPGEIPQVFRAMEIAEQEDPHGAWTAIARLKPGIAVTQARTALNTVMRDLMREHPADYPRDTGLTLQSLDEKLTANVRTVLWVLLGAVGFVLLITCANVANLLLTRATARDTEMAVRAALGGSRRRLVRQVLTESIVLSVPGGLLGVLLAWAATAALLAFSPAEIPRADEIRIDAPILLFALLITLLTAVLFGSAPAFKAARLGLHQMLQESRDLSGGRAARRLRHALVIAEIASAFVLAIGAGLLGRSLNQLLHVNAGYDPRHLLTMTASIYDDSLEKALRHYESIVERVRAIPGVQGAAMVSTLPLSSPQQSKVFVEGRALPDDSGAPVVDSYFATPDYFRVMRIPLRRGRFFTSQDRQNTPPVAIVSDSFARSQFPHDDPIGRRIGPDRVHWATIIGIVGDVWQHGMDEGPTAGVYFPQAQHADFYYRLVVRTSGDPWHIYPAVRAAMRELDPNQPMFHVQPMDDYVTKSLADRLFALALIALLGTLALTLAAVGIYGVISYSVSLRTREFGIRLALGAHRPALLRLVMRDLLTSLAAGLTLGLLTAVALSRFLAHLLYGVQPTDPFTIATSALTLAAVAFAAALLPCRRALRLNPSTALRRT